MNSGFRLLCSLIFFVFFFLSSPLLASPEKWQREWPYTDFSNHTVPYSEIIEGGPRKDDIPAIDDPVLIPVEEETHLADNDPVITVSLAGTTRAYPLAILMHHEIVNDRIGSTPIAVTYCPLCNAAMVFDRRVDGLTLSFGTTGKLRHSDMIMYDRQTESWWQQFTGLAIAGKLAGERLTKIPAKLESFLLFKSNYPEAEILVPNDTKARGYGSNPYVNYDQAEWPFMYRGDYEGEIPPLARVVMIGNKAWPLSLLRDKGSIQTEEYIIRWEPGQSSAQDTYRISEGRDVGTITVKRKSAEGLQDAIYHVVYAFAFKAFHPDGTIVPLPDAQPSESAAH